MVWTLGFCWKLVAGILDLSGKNIWRNVFLTKRILTNRLFDEIIFDETDSDETVFCRNGFLPKRFFAETIFFRNGRLPKPINTILPKRYPTWVVASPQPNSCTIHAGSSYAHAFRKRFRTYSFAAGVFRKVHLRLAVIAWSSIRLHRGFLRRHAQACVAKEGDLPEELSVRMLPERPTWVLSPLVETGWLQVRSKLPQVALGATMDGRQRQEEMVVQESSTTSPLSQVGQ